MKTLLAFTALTLLATPAFAIGTLDVKVGSVMDKKPIPEQYAYCIADTQKHSKPGSNINPEIKWSGEPKGTKSFAIIMHDPDVPTLFDDASKEGKALPESMPRQNFYHWVLVDIPPTTHWIREGQDSQGTPEGGKPLGATEYGLRGQNDYAKFYKGFFGGYDGMCPPWNDEALHHYTFTVYALDTETLGLSGAFNGKEALAAMEGHILAKGSVMGTYTQNPALKGK